MSDDPLQFIAVEFLQQSGGNGDGSPFGVSAGGKGIQRRVVDDVDVGHFLQSRGDLHLLNHVIEPGMVVTAYLLCLGHAQQYAVSPKKGNHVHDSPDYEGDNQTADTAP